MAPPSRSPEDVQATRDALRGLEQGGSDEEDLREERTCSSSKSMMIAAAEAIVAIEDQLEVLAQPFGGRSDGWGSFGNAL